MEEEDGPVTASVGYLYMPGALRALCPVRRGVTQGIRPHALRDTGHKAGLMPCVNTIIISYSNMNQWSAHSNFLKNGCIPIKPARRS
eukprot:COSAG02_NODE_1498_length_12281_cov_14.846741_9_plen_87_part_00